MRMISADELRRLRNDVSVAAVIVGLGLDRSNRGTRPTFRCPRCETFHTAVNERTNLARCFRCAENYNPIDLVMAVRSVGFLDAVHSVRDLEATAREAPLRTVETSGIFRR